MHQTAANAATESVLERVAVSMYVRMTIDDVFVSRMVHVLVDMEYNQHVVIWHHGSREIQCIRR